tara:strand:- start:765 stop:1007 length:243 start_codon:yes stop_codon:yes gene_type:complete
MMSKDKIEMWNGGRTNETKYNEMIRESEDSLDGVDVAIDIETNPREQINKNMDKPTRITNGHPSNRYRKPEGIHNNESKK